MKELFLASDDVIKLMEYFSVQWDKHADYWYPLNKCSRNDVISFDAIVFENHESTNRFAGILMEHEVHNVYELREANIGKYIEGLDGYLFWESDDYFWNGETYWFDDSLDWVVYKSHEGTITFGGNWLISKVKSGWIDWKSHTKWDMKIDTLDDEI